VTICNEILFVLWFNGKKEVLKAIFVFEVDSIFEMMELLTHGSTEVNLLILF